MVRATSDGEEENHTDGSVGESSEVLQHHRSKIFSVDGQAEADALHGLPDVQVVDLAHARYALA